jgi:hypothetical protein
MKDERDPKSPPRAASDRNAEEAEGQREEREYGLRRMRPVDSDEKQREEDKDAPDQPCSPNSQKT